MARTRRICPPALALAVACVAALGVGAPAARAADPTFGTPTIVPTYGTSIDFRQPVTLDGRLARVELLVTEADAIGPQVIDVAPPSTTGSVVLEHKLSTTGDGHLLPNTPISARWRLTPTDSATAPILGPEIKAVYADDRHQWRTVAGAIVRVHWYDGSQAFAERALRIGEDAIAKTSKLLGVTEDQPIDFFIYADRAALYDALGPATRENVGGQENAGIRTLFALIGPNGINDPWVSIVVPHELTHLVFDTAVSNPYHFPPRWLNEGLAVYLSQGYDASDRRSVENAAKAGTLFPLAALGGNFPTSGDSFGLAYAESVSAVDDFIRTYGQDALVTLIRSYADGRTDDEAFQAAIGVDVAGFDAAWLHDVGAVMPVPQGPQAAALGPQPPGWAGAGGTTPVPPPSTVPAPGTPAQGGPVGWTTPVIVLIAILVALGALILALFLGRRRRGDLPT
jgi:hypothetical protein